ncbi:MAG: nucleoside-triphosphatase, partial [Candidatus Hodarchaeota archaeon]
MNRKILITGPPRCGKSTLISKLIKYYTNKKNYKIYGFLTPEVKEHGNRIGFDIVDIYSGEKSQLARVGPFKTKYMVGKYNVFIEQFEKYIEDALNLEGIPVDLIVIDEIGKMELFSKKFQNFIKKIFGSNISILATIGLKLKHSLKDYLLNLPSVVLLNLNRQNFHLI